MNRKAKKYPEYTQKIAANIRRIRVEKGLSQTEIDRALGFGCFVNKLEAGTTTPLLENLYALCEYLDVNIHEILPSNKKPKYRIPLNK